MGPRPRGTWRKGRVRPEEGNRSVRRTPRRDPSRAVRRLPGGIRPGPSGGLPDGDRPGRPGAGSLPGTTRSSVQATAAQSVGVVDINTRRWVPGCRAAGTGLIFTSSGDVLTNNHVINGATRIKATVVATGKTFRARVVGTSPSSDIAVLHLVGASGLTAARLGDSSSVTVGDAVTGVGNAGGTGGTPSAARGTVLALHRKITASGETGAGAETLRGVIVTDAAIASGDSGGPLYDSANGLIGIDTAATAGSPETRGYAIPINRALAIARQIESGVSAPKIHLGYSGVSRRRRVRLHRSVGHRPRLCRQPSGPGELAHRRHDHRGQRHEGDHLRGAAPRDRRSGSRRHREDHLPDAPISSAWPGQRRIGGRSGGLSRGPAAFAGHLIISVDARPLIPAPPRRDLQAARNPASSPISRAPSSVYRCVHIAESRAALRRLRWRGQGDSAHGPGRASRSGLACAMDR